MTLKWKPMLLSVPYVIIVLATKLLLQKLGYPGILDFSDLGIVYTGGVFLMGFNLAGTMADYKEGERIPGELACIFETLEDSLRQAAQIKPALDLNRCRTLHAAALGSVVAWLERKESQPDLFGDISSAIEVAHALDQAGTPAIAGRYVSELHNIRKAVTRIGVISRTNALESGFAFLQFLTAVIIVLLLISKFKHPLTEVIMVSFVSLIYIYMLRLIKDIDDPFEYYPDGRRRGCGEVDLFPILEYQQRLQRRLLPLAPAAGPVPTPPAKTDGATESQAGTLKESTSDPVTDHGTTAHHANTTNVAVTANNISSPSDPSPGVSDLGHGSGSPSSSEGPSPVTA